jgi:hypothetical protein
VKVDGEVAMRNGIPHLISRAELNLGVGTREFGVILQNVVASLTNDLEVSEHSILNQIILEKTV